MRRLNPRSTRINRLTRRQRGAAISLAAVALCLITLDLGGGALSSAHHGDQGAMGSLYRGTDSVLGPARRFLQGLPSAGRDQDRIDQLRQENAQLQGELAAAGQNKMTTSELAALQLAADNGGYRIVPGRVTALGPGDGFDWTVTLDVGSDSGVRVDQSVTDGFGLVGRVLHAAASSSVVLLGSDPGSGVGVRDLRTGQLGVATGRGTAGFSFTPLDPAAVVRVGDRLQTGPAGASSFVAGLSLGTISAVRTSAAGVVTASVTASVSPTALDLVGVILVGGQPVTRAPLRPSVTPGAQAAGGH